MSFHKLKSMPRAKTSNHKIVFKEPEDDETTQLHSISKKKKIRSKEIDLSRSMENGEKELSDTERQIDKIDVQSSLEVKDQITDKLLLSSSSENKNLKNKKNLEGSNFEKVNTTINSSLQHAAYRGGGLLDVSVSFAEFGERYLDRRLTRAITALGLEHPTLVQSAAIPLVLQGKDVLARAKTGSGKTLAYLLPVMQKILEGLGSGDMPASPLQACIVVPARELCAQVSAVCLQLCEYCRSQVTVRHTSESVNQLVKETPPTIIVATPKALLMYLFSEQAFVDSTSPKVTKKNSFWRNHANSKTSLKSLFKSNLKMFVLDEADAMVTLGYQQDLESLFVDVLGSRTIEHRYQAILCSATLAPGVDQLKQLMLHNPAILKLEDCPVGPAHDGVLFGGAGGVPDSLSEFYIRCPWQDKYLLIYALLKLRLVPMKCLIFTSSSERAYSLRLFLHRFSMQAAVLCPLLPFAARMNILQSFDQSLFELLIATDEFLENDAIKRDEDGEEVEEEEEGDEKLEVVSETRNKKTKFRNDKSYGVHRGLDLRGVKCVINYDMPKTEKAYIHRVGRTARAGAKGVALTFCSENDFEEEGLLEKIISSRPSLTNPADSAVVPLGLNLSDIACFRYRVEDILKSVTPKAVLGLRTQDVQREVLHSKKLKQYFETNPEDAQALKKAFRSLQTTTVQHQHLQEIPAYLKPSLSALTTTNPVESAIQRLQQDEDYANERGVSNKRRSKRRIDPLKDFVGAGAKKRYKIDELLSRQLAKEPDYTITAPENLPAISRRKLHKLQRHQPLKKPERMPNFKRRHDAKPKKK